MHLKWAHNADDFRREARRRLPNVIYDYIDQGTLDEITYRANENDFSKVWLKPAIFPELSGFTTRSEIFGIPVDFPLFISPMGVHTMFHPDSDVALARAAQRHSAIFMHSGVSGVTIEETAGAMDPQRCWAQMLDKGNEANLDYLRRIKKLGIKTIIVNAEPKAESKRERDLHNGLVSVPPELRWGTFWSFATHPGWVFRYLTGRKITFADHQIDGRPIKLSEIYGWEEIVYSKAAAWDSIGWFRDNWDGNLVVKGVGNPEAAGRIAGYGVDGIVLSNLGGRHFDGQLSTISVLEDTAHAIKAAGKNAVLIHDGGIRRGGDVVKALALGAQFASAGRPWCYALGSHGPAGVERLFEIFKEEYATAQKQVGALSPREIDRNVIARNDLRRASFGVEREQNTEDDILQMGLR